MLLVSVIIPNYNHGEYLQQRIDSVLSQTYQHFEVIILDDCSTDTSREIIESYRSNTKVRKIIYKDVNSGSPFKQWQKGISEAKGDWIWIAESDDYCEIEFLESAVSALEQTGTSLFFCQSYNVDEKNRIIKDNFWWTEDIKQIEWQRPFCMTGEEFIKEALQFKNVIPNASAVVFRKEAFNFTEIRKYKKCGDWLFWINFVLDKKISYSPECLNYFRIHSNTTRNLDSRIKFLQREMEELSVKYELLKKTGLNKKDELLIQLKRCIDIPSLALYPAFVKLCLHFQLPKTYILKFFLRKVIGRASCQIVK